MSIKLPKIKKTVCLGLFFFSLAFFAQAAEDIRPSSPASSKNSKTEVLQAEKTLSLPASGTVPSDAFSQAEDKELEKTLPFYNEHFADFKIAFQDRNRQSYKAGENLRLNGSAVFLQKAGSSAQKEVEKCLANAADKSDKEKSQSCLTSDIYRFTSFPKSGILAQIWKTDRNSEKRNEKGDYLIDEFYAAENITLDDGQKKDFTVNWKIPEGTESGNYYVSLFLNQNKAFSLLGFPVNVFAPVVRFDFNVTGGEESQGTVIDKNNIKINGGDYSQVLPIPTVKLSEGKINFEIPVSNLGAQEKKVSVKYELYKLTQEDPANKILEQKIDKTIGSKETVKLNFVASEKDLGSFNTLKIALSSEQNALSGIDIHFGVENRHRGVVRFIGLARGEKDGNFYPFFCLRDAQWTGFSKGKVRISLWKNEKQAPAVWEREGLMEARDNVCFILKNENVKLKKTDCVKIKGETFDEAGKTTDSQEISYACPSSKSQSQEMAGGTANQSTGNVSRFLPFIFAIILLVAGVLVYSLKKKTNETNNKKFR